MINFLLGAPGGGKSYEAVVYHILPALERGRKVCTNLPLNVAAFAALDSSFESLIDVRLVTLATPPQVDDSDDGEGPSDRRGALIGRARAARFVARAFANAEDYADPWRHADKGFGPLYVIDEAHFCLPRVGTPRAVSEWFSMHRHFNVDVLLISQSYGKVCADIVDLVQLVYRVRKNIAFGSDSTYTRKVQDGIRGEVMNTSQRSYQSRYFSLYRSHTQGEAVAETMAADIRPIWQHWTFIGAGVCLLVVVVMVAAGWVKNPMNPGNYAKGPTGGVVVARHVTLPAAPLVATAGPVAAAVPLLAASGARAASAPSVASEAPPVVPLEPYAGRSLHLTGYITLGGRSVGQFALSQNGQRVSWVSSAELVAAGYEVERLHDCAVFVRWHGVQRSVICDAPQVGVVMASGVGGAGSRP